MAERYTAEQLVKDKGLMQEEAEQIIKDFDEMDKDKSGQLEFPEIVALVMKESGASEEDAEKLAKDQLAFMDTDKDGKISFNEYVDALC